MSARATPTSCSTGCRPEPLLPVGDVERVLGLKAHVVPEDDAVADAAHAGRPLVRDPKSKAAKAIAALAVQFEELSPAATDALTDR